MSQDGLNSGLKKLDAYYESIAPRELPADSRYFPSITAYPNDDGVVEFQYVGYLENVPDCITLCAQTLTNPARDIVVKFVDRYGQRAHNLLVEADLAPKLLYCGSPHLNDGQPSYRSITMVVMEYIEGRTLAAAKCDMDEETKESMITSQTSS
jgi:hypothetical protein